MINRSNFHHGFIDRMDLLFFFSCIGLLCGYLFISVFPADNWRSVCDIAFSGEAHILRSVLCALFPYMVAATIWEAGFYSAATFAGIVLETTLISVVVFSMLAAYGPVGVVPGVLLAVGRICSLFFMYWYLIRGNDRLDRIRSLLVAVVGSSAAVVLSNQITAPILRILYQSIFNFI